MALTIDEPTMGWLLDKARSVVDAIIQEHIAASARLFRRIYPQLLPFARQIPAMRAAGPGEPVHRATSFASSCLLIAEVALLCTRSTG
jgi:hypothetical protein